MNARAFSSESLATGAKIVRVPMLGALHGCRRRGTSTGVVSTQQRVRIPASQRDAGGCAARVPWHRDALGGARRRSPDVGGCAPMNSFATQGARRRP
jgi:hypothetical protein